MHIGDPSAATSAPSRVRLARADDDATAVAAIYGPVVTSSAASFEIAAPDDAEFRRRIERTLERLPWLVCERDGAVLGYAYATPHRDRPAYRWAVDVSVYVAGDARGSGVGRALYGALLGVLPLQGYRVACAGITLPNPASVALHESLGFVPVGVYRGIGWKLGAWRDVGWWQRPLAPADGQPEEPLAIGAVRGSAAWEAALSDSLPS